MSVTTDTNVGSDTDSGRDIDMRLDQIVFDMARPEAPQPGTLAAWRLYERDAIQEQIYRMQAQGRRDL